MHTLKIKTGNNITMKLNVQDKISFEKCLEFINENVGFAFKQDSFSMVTKEVGYLICLLKYYTDYKFPKTFDAIEIYEEMFEYRSEIEFRVSQEQLSFISKCVDSEIDEIKNSNQVQFFELLRKYIEDFKPEVSIDSIADKIKNLDIDGWKKTLQNKA